jgi:hypothetical protein
MIVMAKIKQATFFNFSEFVPFNDFRDVKIRPLVEYDTISLEKMLLEILIWVKNLDYDRVHSKY